MLPPDARSVLTDLLRPPPDAVLDRAVALTFTLDLESALVVPLAFAAHVMRESSDPLAVMEAVRGCADRVDVFCQAGQVAVPQRRSDLLAFLEPIVHPVRRPRPGRLYHPKLWALRFWDEAEEVHRARLLVLSRNLTPDCSWDVCLRLDGIVGSQPRAANRPLFDLIRRTLDLCVEPLSEDRHAGIEDLGRDLRRVDWELPEGVRDLDFHALGVHGGSMPDFTGSRHLVVAPFCNDKGLELTAPSGTATVVSRQEDLDRLPEGSLDECDVFVVSELAGIPSDELGREEGILTGLHAKLYVVETGPNARLFLGSANATDAAFGGNVELVVELTGRRSQLGIDTLVGVGAPFRTILEPYDRQPPVEQEPDDRALEDLVRELAAVPLTATVVHAETSLAVRLSSESALPATDDVRVTAELLTRPGEAAVLVASSLVDATFAGLAVVDITPFVILTAQDRRGAEASTVVCARLVGDPAGRLDELIARQVDSPEKFLRYLALLLGLVGETGLELGAGGGGGSWVTTGGSGILELLLRALVDTPSQLEDLSRLVERLQSTDRGREVLPDGFTELWQTVDAARRELALEESA